MPEKQIRTGMPRRRLVVAAVLLLCCACASRRVLAGGGPENVLLVVNGDSWISKAVANEYVHLRDIPEINIVTLHGVPTRGTIPVAEFRSQILLPVLTAMKARQIEGQIDYVIYSTDFPYAVDLRGDIGRRKLPKIVGHDGSLTGLTYLYQGVLARNLDYLDLNTNWYARQSLRGSIDTPWSAEEQEQYSAVSDFFAERSRKQEQVKAGKLSARECQAWEKKEWQHALGVMTALRGAHPHSGRLLYNIACGYAQLGHPDKAMTALREAVDGGYRDYRHMRLDSDLTPLRDRPDFSKLIETMETAKIHMVPPMPFSASVGWTPLGTPVPPYKGARYLLSTMLAYTSGRGNSLAEVRNYLTRSSRADGTHPSGTIYFMRNHNVRSTTREWAIPSAAALVEAAGVHAEILEGVLPHEKADVMGVFTGTASFNWPACGSTICPGAICEHLTSFGGVLREGAGQTPLTEWLRWGAAGSSGTVQEPYAIQAKFPMAFMQAYYAMGASLAEAYYLSVRGPYQLLVVGDPLCQPWAKFPQFKVEGLKDGQVVGKELHVSIKAAPHSTPIAFVAYYLDGQRLTILPPAAGLTLRVQHLAPGDHQLRVVAAERGGMQSCGQQVLSFRYGKQVLSPKAITVARQRIPYDAKVRFALRLPKGASVQLFYLGTKVGEAAPGVADLELPASVFGMGPVRVFPVLKLADGHAYIAPMLTFEVVPPPATVLVPAGLGAILTPGMLLTMASGASGVVDRTQGDWLAKAGVKPGDEFELSGWFDVKRDDLYQFQLKGNVDLQGTMHIDDRDYTIPKGAGWRSFPVALKTGGHRFVLKGKAGQKPRLHICFGARGTRTLAKAMFRHRTL